MTRRKGMRWVSENSVGENPLWLFRGQGWAELVKGCRGKASALKTSSKLALQRAWRLCDAES